MRSPGFCSTGCMTRDCEPDATTMHVATTKGTETMKEILYGLTIAAFAAIAAPAQAGTDALKIGVLTDMSGVTADITGKGSVTAAEMAVEECGGTGLSKKIQVILANHLHMDDGARRFPRAGFE